MVRERLESRRLLFRAYAEADADVLFRVVGRREVAANMLLIPHPYPRETVEEWIRFTLENRENETAFEFGLFDRMHPDRYIGNCGLINHRADHRNAELTFFIDPEHWNLGFATEACRALLEFGFSDLGLERIHARCMARNLASRRVLEKSGLRLEGVSPHEVFKWGRFEDVARYGILRAGYGERENDA